jgi:acyl-CoA dehydrogenase
MFRDTCRRFFEKEVTPFHMKWEEEGIVPRELWRKAGAQGLLGMTMPESTAAPAPTFLYSAILIEEQGRRLASGRPSRCTTTSSCPTCCTTAAKSRRRSGSQGLLGRAGHRHRHDRARHRLGPAGGQDHAVMDGNHWVINGSKTFISNGQLADLVIVVAKTDPKLGAKGTSLIAVETSTKASSAAAISRRSA